jgi:hypothetical protein
MSRFFFILLLILPEFVLGQITRVESPKFTVEILQDGNPMVIEDTTVTLQKKPFVIRITLKNQEGIFMNSSFQRDYFDLEENDSIPDYPFIGFKAMAEPNFNEEKALIVDSELFSYLFYDPDMDWHRFDKDVIIRGKSITATKTVDRISLEEEEDPKIEIIDLDKDIYFFFLARDEESQGEVFGELGRARLHIKWK